MCRWLAVSDRLAAGVHLRCQAHHLWLYWAVGWAQTVEWIHLRRLGRCHLRHWLMAASHLVVRARRRCLVLALCSLMAVRG